jgi:hypothetical protein
VNNFDVLKRMSAENKDIRLGVDVLNMKKVRAGSQVTIGIAGDVVTPVFTGELCACLLIYNKKQFNETKAAIEAEGLKDG